MMNCALHQDAFGRADDAVRTEPERTDSLVMSG
jgi:hypothetical protein